MGEPLLPILRRDWAVVSWVLLLVVVSFGSLVLIGSGTLASLDWASFIPDLIVGVATGVAAGFVLSVVHRRRLRASMLYDWTSARRVIHDFVMTRELEPNLANLGELGSISSLAQLVNGYPLREWERELRAPEITMITQLVRLLASLDSLGPDVSQMIVDRSGRGLDPRVHAVAAGQLVERTEGHFMVQGMLEPVYAGLAREAARVLTLGTLRSKGQDYARRWKQADNLVRILRVAL